MPAGRPTHYLEEMCQTVIECGKEGKTIAEMAVAVDISRENFNEWRKAHPEFGDAVKSGLAYAQGWWEAEGRKATFKSEGFAQTAYIFQMKNRFRDDWADRSEVGHDVTGGLSDFLAIVSNSTKKLGHDGDE